MCLVWRHFRFSIFLEISYLYIWLVWRQAVSSEAQRSGRGYLHESRDCVISRVPHCGDGDVDKVGEVDNDDGLF